MVAAKKSISTEDDVFRIYPFARIGLGVIVKNVHQGSILTPWAQGTRRYSSSICENVIAPFRPKGARETHKGHLDWSWPCCKYLVSSTASITIKVDENVNAIIADLLYQALWAPAADVPENRRLLLNLLTVARFVTRGCCIAESSYSLRVVKAKHGLHPKTQLLVSGL